jgi:vanadium chloroperoxidase
MIIENGLSRVDLGVHWVFDAFAVTTDEYGRQAPDLTQPIGGVHLGLAIAEDIWQAGLQVSPVLPLAG